LRLAEVSFSMKEKMSLMARGLMPRMSSLVFIGDGAVTCTHATPPPQFAAYYARRTTVRSPRKLSRGLTL
jgi:hypothetical protein